MEPPLGQESQDYVKVLLVDGEFKETLWAVRLAPDQDLFRLANSPFFAYRVSYGDVVTGVEYAPDMYEFSKVVTRSGNRTIRVILADDAKGDTPAGKRVLDGLVALGCTYEGVYGKTMSVTVPAMVDLRAVTSYLVGTGLTWEYADPTYDDLFPAG